MASVTLAARFTYLSTVRSTPTSPNTVRSTPTSPNTLRSTPTSALVPYAATGGEGVRADRCHVYVKEISYCGDDTGNLAVAVIIRDAVGRKIGHHGETAAGATKPLSVTSKLEFPLVVTPEHRGDYVQFGFGKEGFNSLQTDNTKPSWCDKAGWDYPSGPVCGKTPTYPVSRSFYCVGWYFG